MNYINNMPKFQLTILFIFLIILSTNEPAVINQSFLIQIEELLLAAGMALLGV